MVDEDEPNMNEKTVTTGKGGSIRSPNRRRARLPERLKRVKQNSRRSRITTSPPKVKLSAAGTPKQDYGRLRLLSERARVEAARRAVDLEKKNPNKVITTMC